MYRKKFYMPLVLGALLVNQLAAMCLAGPQEQLEQAKTYQLNERFQQAEQTYKAIVTGNPGTDYAFEAQKSLVVLYIVTRRYAEAQQAYDKLLADFPSHSLLPSALYEIAGKYAWQAKADEAKGIYQQLIQEYPQSPDANKAQLDLIKADILYFIKVKDDFLAQQAIDNLVSSFSEHTYLPEALFWIEIRCIGHGKYEMAKSTCQQIIQRAGGSLYAYRAQLDIARADVLALIDSKDYTAAQAAADSLKTNFAGHTFLDTALYSIAKRFEAAKKVDKAKPIYQHIAQAHPRSPALPHPASRRLQTPPPAAL